MHKEIVIKPIGQPKSETIKLTRMGTCIWVKQGKDEILIRPNQISELIEALKQFEK